MEIPEIDRVEFFDLGTAKKKIKAGQEVLIEALETAKSLIAQQVGRLGGRSNNT